MEFDNLHQILRSLYEQMMPLCGDMAGVAKGIAGLGALFYVAYRVWQSLARAEPIDVFPMQASEEVNVEKIEVIGESVVYICSCLLYTSKSTSTVSIISPPILAESMRVSAFL